MRGLILAGGTGSRLRPLTYTSAKQLIPVANKPILFYAIETLRDAGIEEVILVVGDTEAEIREAVGDGSRFGVRASYVRQEAPLGLAHAVRVAEPFLRGDDFCMFLGDNLLQGGIRALIDAYRARSPDAMILLSRVENPQEFGVAQLDGEGRVVRLVEKPKHPPSNLALVGVYLFKECIFDAVRDLRPSWRNELEITDAIQILIDRKYHVHSQEVSGWWKDTGKPEDVVEANRLILDGLEGSNVPPEAIVSGSRLEGRIHLEPGARVIDSVLRGPVIVGSGAVIERSFIGPFTSVGREARVADAEIQNSIIMDEAAVRGIVGADASLIGRGARIERDGTHVPRAMCFVLGDRSRVVLP